MERVVSFLHGVQFNAATDGSSVADIVVPVVMLALVVTVAVAVLAARRARSRRGHAQIEATGRGLWEGTISDWELIWLFPETKSTSRGRALLRALLTSDAVPVSRELDPDGLRLRLTGRLARQRNPNVWSAPWTTSPPA
jgi:hypothetical protein